MMHKTRPHEAVRSAPAFVVQERERKIKAKEITKEQADEQERTSQVATTATSKKDSEANAEVDIASVVVEGQRQQPGAVADTSGNTTELASSSSKGEIAGQTRGETCSSVGTAGALTDSLVVV
jgi:hypothetical protein